MTEDGLAKIQDRLKRKRIARDEVLRRIGSCLREKGFKRAGATHFTRSIGDLVCHIGFQKFSSGESVRVMCHISRADAGGALITGPWSDAYEYASSPNGRKYQFRCSPLEADIARSTVEYCNFIDEVVIPWFNDQISRSNEA